MSPDEIDRLYAAVMLASPLALVGTVLFLMVWLWPVRGRK